MEKIKEILKEDEQFVSDDDKLLKNAVATAARNLDEDLLGLLLNNEAIKTRFFTEIDDTKVFAKSQFIDFIYNKNFLADSYTKFKNKIGLTFGDNGDLISNTKDVVLSWPYKDCVLEGGQTKEDAKR